MTAVSYYHSDISCPQISFPVLHLGCHRIGLLAHTLHVQLGFVAVPVPYMLIEAAPDRARGARSAGPSKSTADILSRRRKQVKRAKPCDCPYGGRHNEWADSLTVRKPRGVISSKVDWKRDDREILELKG